MDYNHERVMLEKQIPAKIGILNDETIKQYFPHEICIPAHWHRSLEICLLEDCEIVLQIGKKEYFIHDDFTCVNSGVVHSLYAKRMDEESQGIILLISYDFMKQHCPNIDHISFDLSLKKEHDDLKLLYYRLRNLYLNQDKYSYLNITACIFEIFSLLLREYSIENTVPQTNSIDNQNQIKGVLTYLHEHYQEPLTLNDMAVYFHMSKEHFSRQFHHHVGKTFRDYLSSYRLYKAYEDIIHTDMTIQDIARIHGFLNVKSFIKLFRETYHQTPLQYRKNMLDK